MWRDSEPAGRWRQRGKQGVGLAMGVALAQLIGTRAAAVGDVPPRSLGLLAYALLAAGPVALLWRRRAPVLVLAVTTAATVGFAVTEPANGPFFVALVVALYGAVKAGRPGAAVAVAALGYTSYLAAATVLADPLGVPAESRPDLGAALVLAALVMATVLAGGAAKVRADHFAEMSKARAEQARARAEQQRRQASEERLRIARELHDVLGHHLSLINVQAGVGLHLMDSRPEQARSALTAIKTASAEALREVRAVLGVLRPEEEAAPRQPAPGLDRLAELTADAGLPVHTRVRGAARPLPAEVDRAAYRIVQEALTNVRRHAGPQATAVVIVGYDDQALSVRVDDDGPVTPAVGDGNGIAGMRARAEALGGTLQAGPRDDGGFRVAALLPTGDTA
ncbi:MAG TPA: sensor histidine kinase [Catenuloplanes sp.]